MALDLVTRPEYRVVPGRIPIPPPFSGMLVTEGSGDWLVFPETVKYAADRGAVLQSLAQAAAVRVATADEPRDSPERQSARAYNASRLACIYLVRDGTPVLAFDDDPLENILLRRAEEGRESHVSSGGWPIQTNDSLLARRIERAYDLSRVVDVLPASGSIALSTAALERSSPFGTHNVTRAMLQAMAEPYAALLNSDGCSVGHILTLDRKTLKRLGISESTAEVRWAGLGGDGYLFINYLVADSQCYVGGRARGVRENFQAK